MKSPRSYCQNTVYSISSSSSSLSSSASIRIKSAWHILTKSAKRSKSSTSSTSTASTASAFTLPSSTFSADRRISNGSSNSSSINTPPSSRTSLTSATPSSSSSHMNHHARKKKWIENNNAVSQVTVPPFSPTYCKFNEFPYSNFYVKLPNGRWMVRYRSGNRDILGTDEFEGYMI